MSAGKGGDGNFHRFSGGFFGAKGKFRVRPDSAGAACKQRSLVLGVKVDEHSALEYGNVERICSVHSRLLVNGENNLKRGVRNIAARKNFEHIRSGNSVVSAEGGSLCKDEVLVLTDRKGVGFKVDLSFSVAYANHVKVTLKNDRLAVFIAL